MDSSNSLLILEQYADEWGITLPTPLRVVSQKRWFRCIEQHIVHESDECSGIASIVLGNSRPSFVDFRPRTDAITMLPPWAAYPSSTSVWGGWRQGYGDGYLRHWHQWLEALPQNDRIQYLTRYPAPNDDRLWLDWFESAKLSFIPSTGG